MDQNERIKLQKQYEQYADAQVLELLEDGPAAFVEGAYSLLEQEAERRGISREAGRPDTRGETTVPEPASADPGLPETFVEIMVINHDADRDAVAQAMEPTGIPYHFMKMSMAGKELPVALMVDQRRIEETVEKLERIRCAGSIVLW